MCDRESRDMARAAKKNKKYSWNKKNPKTDDNEDNENKPIIAQNPTYVGSESNSQFPYKRGVLFLNKNTTLNINDDEALNCSLRQLLHSNSAVTKSKTHDMNNHQMPMQNCEQKLNNIDLNEPLESESRVYPENDLLTAHPVYRTISVINGSINRMNLNEMQIRCKELHLHCNGKREAVKRRLKEYYKTENLIEAGLLERRSSDERNSDFFVVVDFEATCEERNPPGYPHEIIEFPAVLVSAKEKTIIDVFHFFVRPTINPILSEFCHNLTGISQGTVDNAEIFEVVHQQFLEWMSSHQLGTRYTYTMVTDGPFDMGRFLYLQSRHISMPFPYTYASTWANLRKCFANFYKGDFYGGSNNNSTNRLPGLQTMLDMLGLEFEGTPHSGVDDARNIARILIRLLSDRAFVRVNEKIYINKSSKADDDNRSAARLANVIPVPRKEAERWFLVQKKEVQNYESSQHQFEQDSDADSFHTAES